MTDGPDPPLTAAHKLFCFGLGYSAATLTTLLGPCGMRIAGTRTHVPATSDVPLAAFDGSGHRPDIAALLAGTTHVLLSIPPDAHGDLALRYFRADLAALPSLQWIGYLSTIGVYGDAGGAWVDEITPVCPASERGARRALAENQWCAFAAETGKRVDIFRLPGIYGPGRSVIEQLKAGTARRVIKPGQVFNRIHVTDIAGALERAMALAVTGQAPDEHIYNLVDDEPAPPQDVIAFAAHLLGLPSPPEIPFETANLSPMARSFYSENKRVRNVRLKTALRFQLTYPSYREGLRAIAQGGVAF